MVASSSAYCIPEGATKSEKKLLRLWLTVRVFFVLFGISFWILLIGSPFINNTLRYNVAYEASWAHDCPHSPAAFRALFSLRRVHCVWRGAGTSFSA